MSNYAIVSDATTDLNAFFQKEFNIQIIPAHLVFPGKKEIASFTEWEYCSREEFYDDLKKRPDEYHTSPPNVTEIESFLIKYAEQGKDVLLITISGGISGTYGFASAAIKNVKSKYPDVNILCVDSGRFSSGCGVMVLRAAMNRDEGMSLEENYKYLENNKSGFHQAGWMDDLQFVAKKGRITHAKALIGTLAGIKSIGEFDENGLTTVIGKVRGASKAYRVLLDYIEQTIVNPSEQIIFVAHSNRLAQAEEYRRLIEERFHPKAVYVNDIFPSCGINIGPGLMAAYYYGKPISENLENEKNILKMLSDKG